MGLLCSKDNYTQREIICDKCKGTFTAKKRDRTSCRVHKYDENGECIHCYVNILSNTTKNCYHKEKKTWWSNT